jgi:hypothetical protein
MKRMSDVFNGEPCGFSTRMTDEQVRAGQHAINHVDALADALDALLSMLESEGRQGEEMFKDCEKISNAYWGIK